MTFLPIVQREMLVAARRRGTYRTRMLNAGVATLAFAVCFIGNLIDPSISFVKSVFWGLSGLCLVHCLAAGRVMTADCLSREKREGTLGLLFLTDLKGYDVVLGKLAATSLDGFYGLLAVLPLLALPIMAGGMTSGEFWRMALVLVNTFLFSAGIGLFVSSVSRDERKVMGANLALLLWLAALPPAVFGLLKLAHPRLLMQPAWFYSCPVYSFIQCADKNYKLLPRDYWCSAGMTFGLTLALLLLACWTAPRSWQDKPVRARSRSLRPAGAPPRRSWRQGRLAKAGAFRKWALDRNAYFWLAARPYIKAAYVWTALGLIGCFWAATALSTWSIEEESNIFFALLLNALLKLWITAEAGQQLAADKKSGAFELLLSSPLSVRDIVRGQWLALRRLFLKPLVAAVGVELALMFSVLHSRDASLHRWLWLAGVLMLASDAIALGWVAMSSSLTSKSHGRATLKTAASILILPWALFVLEELAAHFFMFLFSRQPWDSTWRFDLGCWFGTGILLDVCLALQARRRLHESFRQLGLEALTEKRRLAWWHDWRTGSPARKAEVRARLRRITAAAACVLAAGAGLILYDVHLARADLPKPVIVSISQNRQPARIFSSLRSADGFMFILSDGTLWTWGRQGIVSPPRQLGTNRDWLQVSIKNVTLGLRANGTLWSWADDNDRPIPFGSDHDWAQACSGDDWYMAVKRDGTLWGWGMNRQSALGQARVASLKYPDPVQLGARHDWLDVGNVAGAAIFGLSTDGTLWTWGAFDYSINGVWKNTNHVEAVQLCRESNWIGFNDQLASGMRNQEGQSWDLLARNSPPGPGVSITSLGRMISSNASMVTFGPLYTTNWSYAKYELRPDGTLWATAPNATPVRFGRRSDWISVRGSYQTIIGITSDGTLWTWGLDYGRESHWVDIFKERIGVVKAMLGAIFGNRPDGSWGYISDQYPPQKEPRPLLRMVAAHAASSDGL